MEQYLLEQHIGLYQKKNKIIYYLSIYYYKLNKRSNIYFFILFQNQLIYNKIINIKNLNEILYYCERVCPSSIGGRGFKMKS